MNGLPSILELERSLKALDGAAPSPEVLEKALHTGRALLRWVRYAGTPPVQEPTEKQRAQSLGLVSRGTPMHLARAPMPSSFASARAEQRAYLQRQGAEPAPAAAKVRTPLAPSRPEGCINTAEVIELLGRHSTWLSDLRSRPGSGFPEPAHCIKRTNWYLRSEIMAWKTQEDERQAALLRAGGKTIGELAKAAGLSVAYLRVLQQHKVLELPEIASVGARPARWTDAQILRVLPILRDPARRSIAHANGSRDDKPGRVSTRQMVERLGLKNLAHLHALVHQRRMPAADIRDGRWVFWSEELAARIEADRKGSAR